MLATQLRFVTNDTNLRLIGSSLCVYVYAHACIQLNTCSKYFHFTVDDAYISFTFCSVQFTKDKGHIFVSVHLADEVKSPLDVKDEVLRHSLNLIPNRPNAAFNTLSGLPVVDRWRSWEKFKNLCGMLDETEKIKLLVTVEDTGEGIVHEAQGRIFTPFVQADSSTSRKYGGTGIGLSISKRLVDLMGGEIGFVSEPGTGSTFSFTAAFTKVESNSGITKREQYDLAVSEFRGLKALVIDDKNIRAEVTRYQLKRLGILVDIASTADAGCSYLSNCTSR